MRNKVQLITYADRLAGTIRGVEQIIDQYFGAALGGVHLLPFFTPYDGADAGFDPQDHTKVDPRLGTWDDVRAIGANRDVVVDVIVNHVSHESKQFTDYIKNGDASTYSDMFLTFSSVFPEGATEEDLTSIYRPRPGLPFTPVTVAGKKCLMWTTFTPQQIDIDVHSQSGRAYLRSILETLAAANVSLVRLDAVGYAIKTPGTSSFMTPQTFEFISEFTAQAKALGMDVLVEVHSHYQSQINIGKVVDRVYDFALPPLLLHALHARDAKPLNNWIQIRPENSITVLDTHDGIGVIDVGADAITGAPGLLDPRQLDALVESMHAATQGESRQATGAAASNLDLYQVNSTFFDALGADDHDYLIARLVQFFLPGIPQVYYVGALAGHNDMDLLAETGVGRDINRHRYSPEEIAQDFNRPVVRALVALMRLRNEHPAFDGVFSHATQSDSHISLAWTHDSQRIEAEIDFATRSVALSWTLQSGETTQVTNLVDEIALNRR